MKNKFLKALTSLVLVTVMVTSLLPVTMLDIFAAEGTYTLVTDASALKAGDRVIIVASDYSYALSTTQNGNNRGQAAVTKNNNTIVPGADVQVLTLEAGTTSGTFAFHTGSGYLYAASSSKNYLKTETSLSANSSWTIAIGETGVATVTAQGSNTHNLMQYNAGSSLFSAYGSAQKSVSIYKLETTSGGDTSCEHTNKTSVVAKDATCTEEGNIAYSYCSDCGTYWNAEDVVIEGEGTVISALGHKYENGFCVNGCGQAEPTAPKYELTDLANIKPGDKVIIVATKDGATYAMSNDNGTTSGPAPIQVEVVDGIIQTEATNILWNITYNTDGTFTVYVNGTTADWLYCTSVNDGVRVGDNTNKTFTLDASSGYLKHTATSRYLGVYNTKDWRCYTSTTGNISGQTFAFYVLPCDHAGASEVAAKDATCTEDGYSAHTVCPACGELDKVVYPATGHNHDDGVVTTDPTCIKDGVKTFTCACGDTYTEPVEATGHSYVDGICSNCSEAQCTEHDYSIKGEVVTQPTCTTEGKQEMLCSVCGLPNPDYVSIPVIAHTEVIDEAVAPGCTTTGLTEGSHCSVCNTVIIAQTVVAAVGHTFDGDTCTECGYVKLPFEIGDVIYFGYENWVMTGVPDDIGVVEDTDTFAFGLIVISGATDGTYAFKTFDGQYLEYHGTANKLYLADRLDANSSWYCTASANNKVEIKNAGATENRYLRFNSNTNQQRFACYKSGMENPVITVAPISLAGYSISLKGDIGFKVYYKADAEWLANNATTSITVAIDGTTIGNFTVADLVAEGDYYVITCDITPDQINKELVWTIGEYVNTVSVASYRDLAVSNGYAEESDLIALVDALLKYGTAADAYVADPNGGTYVGGDTIPSDLSNGLTDANLSAGLNGNLGSTVTLRFVITGDITGYTFKLSDGTTEKVVTLHGGSNNTHVLSLNGIYAQDFDTVFTLTLRKDGEDDQTISASVLSYAYIVQNGAYSGNLQNLAVALYNYGVAVNNYTA